MKNIKHLNKMEYNAEITNSIDEILETHNYIEIWEKYVKIAESSKTSGLNAELYDKEVKRKEKLTVEELQIKEQIKEDYNYVYEYIIKNATDLTESRLFNYYLNTYKKIITLEEFLDLTVESSFEIIKEKYTNYEDKYEAVVKDLLTIRFVKTWISLIREMQEVQALRRNGYTVLETDYFDSILGVDYIVVSEFKGRTTFKYIHVTTSASLSFIENKEAITKQRVNAKMENEYTLKNVYKRDFTNDIIRTYNINREGQINIDEIALYEVNGWQFIEDDRLKTSFTKHTEKIDFRKVKRNFEYADDKSNKLYKFYNSIKDNEDIKANNPEILTDLEYIFGKYCSDSSYND